ncbi:MAG: hypothetical protein PW788_06220 [Micavibrio sp.]|nr:hypothetical protein [Micavibrio sp.]
MADKPSDSEKNNMDKSGGKKAKPVLTDADAIDTLPLSIIPLSTSSLKSAKLVKNSRLETALEIHNDPIAGRLQINPADVVKAQVGSAQDKIILERLATLPSYDVYSLRSSLKRLGIPIDETVLELSDGMKDTLQKYTQEFTHPLILHIFGEEGAGPDTTANILKLFNDTDKTRVALRLKMMSEKTGMSMAEIPAFLADYSDVFLSVAYYRHTFYSVVPDVSRFWLWLNELRNLREDATSPRTLASARKVEESLRFISGSIRERLAIFQKGFDLFWTNISKESFAQLQKEVEENHAGMGAVLCGLVVKMRNWSQAFPDNDIGSPAKRAQYIITEMEPGLEQLKLLENDARGRIGLSVVHMF